MAAYVGSDGRQWIDVAANKTLTKDTDSGVVQNVTADGKTVTLPAAAAGIMFTIRNAGVAPASAAVGAVSDGTVAVTIAPNGTDTIGGGGRAAANSNYVNTKATSVVGDEVTLLGVSGAWQVVAKRGTWA